MEQLFLLSLLNLQEFKKITGLKHDSLVLDELIQGKIDKDELVIRGSMIYPQR